MNENLPQALPKCLLQLIQACTNYRYFRVYTYIWDWDTLYILCVEGMPAVAVDGGDVDVPVQCALAGDHLLCALNKATSAPLIPSTCVLPADYFAHCLFTEISTLPDNEHPLQAGRFLIRSNDGVLYCVHNEVMKVSSTVLAKYYQGYYCVLLLDFLMFSYFLF